MRADDDGFVNNPKKIQRMIGASDDDCKILVAKRFVITFESGVIVIKHWKIHNYIRSDRYKETTYLKEKSELETDKNNAYTERHTIGIPNDIPTVDKRDTQVRLGKVSIGKKEKENILKEKEATGDSCSVTLDNVIDSQKECLRKPLREFVKMRKAIKKPITTYGLSLLLGNLFKLANTDEEQVKIIEQSILKGWQGIFPLSKEHSDRPPRRGEGKGAAEFPQREYSREEHNSIFQYDDGGEL